MTVALITGATSGIGLEFARILADKKCTLVLIGRNSTKLRDVKKELSLKTKVITILKDLSEKNSYNDIITALEIGGHLKIDYLINNAGFGDFGSFEESDFNKNEDMINVNITALTGITHRLIPHMNKDSYIVNVASTAGFSAIPTMAVYAATKAYVLNFSLALSEELKKNGISVTALCPGPTHSNFAHLANAENSGFFSGKLPSSREVAQFGINSMLNGKKIAIHGRKYRILIGLQNFIPRTWQVKIISRMNHI